MHRALAAACIFGLAGCAENFEAPEAAKALAADQGAQVIKQEVIVGIGGAAARFGVRRTKCRVLRIAPWQQRSAVFNAAQDCGAGGCWGARSSDGQVHCGNRSAPDRGRDTRCANRRRSKG